MSVKKSLAFLSLSPLLTGPLLILHYQPPLCTAQWALQDQGETLGFQIYIAIWNYFQNTLPFPFCLEAKLHYLILSHLFDLFFSWLWWINNNKKLHFSSSLSIHSSNSRHIAASISRFSFVGSSLCTSVRRDSNSLILVFVCPKWFLFHFISSFLESWIFLASLKQGEPSILSCHTFSITSALVSS